MGSKLTGRILLVSIILFSLYIGLTGGFVRHHLDSEFASTSQNKTYFLHSIYKGIAEIELSCNQQFLNKYQGMPINKFLHLRRTNAITLYIVAVIFCTIGILGCFLVGEALFNQTIGLLAAFLLGSSFMWASYLHYPTVDLPVTALCILSYYAMLMPKLKNETLDTSDRILLSILIGLSLVTKYAGALLLVPFTILHFDKKNIKQSLINTSIIIVSALLIFIYFMSNKINVFNQTIKYEIEALYKSGFIGFENPTGQTYIYHMQHTLLSEYGFVATLLGLFGIFIAYKKLPRQIFWSFASFPLLIYTIMGSMVLETPRYIMPILPFIAISSALGLHQITEIIISKFNLQKNSQTILIIIFVLISQAYGINMICFHNRLLSNTGSEQNLDLALRKLKPHYNRLFSEPLLRFLPYGFRNIKSKANKNLLDCNAEKPIDFKKTFFWHEKNIVTLSSFWLDSFVYDWHFQCEDPSRRAFSNYEDLHLFEISPFKIDKALVPHAHESVFSPKPPDIWYRKKRGLYFEILIKDDELANQFEKLAKELQIDYKHKKGKESFFLSKIQGYRK